MNRAHLIDKLKSLEPALRAEGVRHLALYGSRARGDNRSDSDIDLLVEVDDESPFTLLELIGVQHIVGDATGIVAHATMRRSLESGFRQNIEADTVDVF